MELPAHEELEEFLADLDYLQDMEVCNQLFVFQPEAFNLLVSRIQPADADKFKEELHNATNSQHKFREIFNDYPDVDQWREILRYIHFTCDPTKCRPKYEENREVFYAKQKLCASGTHAAIYKRSTEGKNVRELHNLYEFNLLLNTMEWMMAGEDWLAIQKNGGAGGVQGITNLLSPLEPSNPAGHDYGDGDNYERRRRRDLIAQKFPIKAKTRDPTHTASETKRSKKAKGLLIEQTNAPLPTSPTHAPSISVVSPTTATPAPIEKALDISGATTETLVRFISTA